MKPQRAERKLAAVLAADIAGYTRLMDADEDATMAVWWSHRQELIDAKITEYRGRIVKLTGDGFLAEFPSALDAVSAAVEIQTEVARRNVGTRKDRRLEFRMGINLCDIMADDEDIYGHGVNLAARLEALAEPGGIYISSHVYDQVKHNLELDYECLGEHSLKNVEEPLTVYSVRLDFQSARKQVTDAPSRAVNWQWPVATVVVALVAVGGTALWFKRDSALEPGPNVPEKESMTSGMAPTEIAAPPANAPSLTVAGKPSIAVLPFSNISADPHQEYFVDGMTETLITDLSLISGVYVSSRNAVFVYKGKSVNVRQVANELGVLYVLEGSVQRDGTKVRINAQLIDANSGGHVWAARYDGVIDDVFALQDDVTRQIVEALAVRLTPQEAEQVAQRETRSVAAYEALQQGLQLYQGSTSADFAKAIPHLEKALTGDPNYARAHAVLAAIYQRTWSRKWHQALGVARDEALEKARQHLQQAMQKPTPLAHQVASSLYYIAGRHDLSIAEAERAITLAPEDAGGYFAMAKVLIYASRPDDGLDYLYTAMELDPKDPPEYLIWLGMARFLNENFQKAARSLNRASKHLPNDATTLALLAATYGHLGRRGDAELTFARLNELDKADAEFQVLDVDKWPFKEQKDRQRLREGLRLAGLQVAS